MSEEKNSEQPDQDGVPTGPASTPLDHPYFLPFILGGMSIWFGYDGFINQDPEMLEHQSFNRIGFAILVPLFLWFSYKGKREQDQIAAERQDGSDPPAPIG